MTPQQKEALRHLGSLTELGRAHRPTVGEVARGNRHLGSLTELGRAGENPAPQLEYKPGGKQNGVMLHQMGVTDADMKCFALLPEFHSITLSECPVSDLGFRHLSNQHKLEMLDIGGTSITSLHPLRNASRLQVLLCYQLEKLTDRKALALEQLPALRFLDLSWAVITDATLKRLSAAPLGKLSLTGTKITDDGLRYLAEIETLEHLGLYHTDVSDAGLRHLHSLPNLCRLVVGNTRITPNGKRPIRRKMPSLKVEDRGLIW